MILDNDRKVARIPARGIRGMLWTACMVDSWRMFGIPHLVESQALEVKPLIKRMLVVCTVRDLVVIRMMW